MQNTRDTHVSGGAGVCTDTGTAGSGLGKEEGGGGGGCDAFCAVQIPQTHAGGFVALISWLSGW